MAATVAVPVVDLTRPSPASPFRSWPLTLLLAGYPVWWLLGLSAMAPLLVAIPMALQLIRAGRVRAPRGFGWWVLFAVWVAASVTMLWVDAPGAVPGGGTSRLLVYAFRAAWYLACAIVLLWLGNADREAVPTERVMSLLGWMFVVTVAGGVLGTLAPAWQMASPVEMLLPGGLRANSFVKGLVHVRAATLSTFLGYVQYRPTAPFAFANSWGANFSLFLPFFLVTWLRSGAGWRRWLAPAVLVLAAIPVVYSMNRALWGALGLGVAYLVVRLLVRGNVAAVAAVVVTLVVAGLAFFASPLADATAQRLANAHSNDRREQLLTLTLASAAEVSPVVGFGSTRDVQGSFASIAGGSTPECPACGVPPLGTQGQMWLVVFSQGLVGAAFFFAFFLRRAWACRRSRSTTEAVAFVALLFLGVELPVYDTLGMPLLTVMAALALAWRDNADADSVEVADLVSRWRHGVPLILTVAMLGAAAGGAVAVRAPTVYAAKTLLLLAPAPLTLDTSTGSTVASGNITVDTEAALVLSEAVLDPLTGPGLSAADLRDRIAITATPNTQVLTLEYRDTDRDRAAVVVGALAENYLSSRGAYLAQRRQQVLHMLDDALAGSPDPTTESEIRAYITEVRLTNTQAGEVIRGAETGRIRNEIEVPVVSGAMVGLLVGLASYLLWALLSGQAAPHSRPLHARNGPPARLPLSLRSNP